MSIQHENFELRKLDHINLAKDPKTQNLTTTSFDRVRLIHEALPDFNLSDVSLQTELLGKKFLSPHFISSMTAGNKKSIDINLMLAQAASEKQWLMAVGSQRRELTDTAASDEWVKIRKKCPKTQFVSNIGLEEIVKTPIDKILKLVESIQAIGLFVHLNPLQEAFQNYDQAQFKNGVGALKKLVQKCPVPVLIKEVGFGISANTAKKLFDVGISVIDVAGKGGTHWAILEGLRHKDKNNLLYDSSLAFQDWGFSAVESLILNKNLMKKNQFWASGGIRSGVDSYKCLALGAKAVGLAQPLMKAILDPIQNATGSMSNDNINFESALLSVSKVMDKFDYELRVAMFATGVINLRELKKKKVIYEIRNV